MKKHGECLLLDYHIYITIVNGMVILEENSQKLDHLFS